MIFLIWEIPVPGTNYKHVKIKNFWKYVDLNSIVDEFCLSTGVAMQERLRPNNGGSGSATLLFLSAFILFCSSLLLIRLDTPVLPNPQFLKFKCCTTEEHEAAAIKYFQNVALNREQKFYIKSALSLSRTTGHLEFYLLFLCLVLILVFFYKKPYRSLFSPNSGLAFTV